MKTLVLALALCAACASAATPLSQIISMLGKMLEKAKKEHQEEKVGFAAFKEWCGNTIDENENSISNLKKDIEQLTASIEDGQATAAEMGEQIGQHNRDIATVTQQMADLAQQVEEKTQAYQAEHLDYSQSISALERAINVLKNTPAATGEIAQTGAAAGEELMQVHDLPKTPQPVKKAIVSFLQNDNAPQVSGHEGSSGQIVEMLQGLLQNFQKEKNELEMEFLKAKGAFDLLRQSYTDEKTGLEQSLASLKVNKGKTEAKVADDQGSKEQAEIELAEDQEYLSNCKATCTRKSEAFEQRQVTRAAEMEMLKTVLEIMRDPAVSGAQGAQMFLFAQLRSAVSAMNPVVREQAAKFLFDKAMKLHSATLKLVATSTSAGDPFKKIRGMIRDLIDKLVAERQAEAEEHAFCETELAANKNQREALDKKIEETQTDKELAKARKQKAAELVAQLSGDLTALKAALAEATAQRNKERATNAETIADTKAGQEGVEKALQIIKDFYDNNSSTNTGASFDSTQTDVDLSGDNTQHQAGHNVIVMMNQLLSDFAKLEAETQASEAQAQAEFEAFQAETEKNMAVKEKAEAFQTQEREEQGNNEEEDGKQLEDSMSEREKVMQQYQALKKQCLDTGLSYEERVQKRKEEIQSLKEALEILEQAA